MQSPTDVSDHGSQRRGSSLFPYLSDGSDRPYGRPNYLNYSGSHSDHQADGNEGKEDQEPLTKPIESKMANPVHVQLQHQAQDSSPGLGEAARVQQQILANSQDLPGGINHRPLVGGFAAAAYEAAKEHYYSTKGRNEDETLKPNDARRPPPCI